MGDLRQAEVEDIKVEVEIAREDSKWVSYVSASEGEEWFEVRV